MSKNKRKKHLVELGFDNLDNTAPYKKILEDLQHKNPKAFKFTCQVLGKRSLSAKGFHYTLLGHPLQNFPEDFDGDVALDYFEGFPYRSGLPKIITDPKYEDKEDPVSELLKIKQKWLIKLKSLRAQGCFIKEEFKVMNDDVVYCPMHFVTMAAHIDSEPEPHFKSRFNWYYSGAGNLHQMDKDGRSYIVHSEFSCLYISSFDKESSKIDCTNQCSFDCGSEHNILETLPLENHLVLRTKNVVFIVKILSIEDNITLELISEIKSLKMQYTSVSFDPYHKNIIYLTKLNGNFEIINLNTLQCKDVLHKNFENDKLNDNWNTVIGFDRLHYIQMSKNKIDVFDKRNNEVVFNIDMIRKVCDKCMLITLVKKSESTPFIYVGTNHHLFCIDIRSGRDLKPKILMRWTHGLKCPPVYISICEIESQKDLICISSQWCEDNCFIVNDIQRLKRNLQAESVMFPYHPLNILTAFEEGRKKKYFLDIYSDVEKRFCTFVTGVFIYENDDTVNLVVQNSLGDVSVIILYPERLKQFIQEDSIEKLDIWSKKLKSPAKLFEISNLVEISPLLEEFRDVKLTNIIEDFGPDVSNFNENELLNLFNSETFDEGLLTAWELEDKSRSIDKSTSYNFHLSMSQE